MACHISVLYQKVNRDPVVTQTDDGLQITDYAPIDLRLIP